MKVPTLQGEEVTITTTDGVKVNDANVVIADVGTDNGVIHAIDAVIVPPSIDVGAFLETCPAPEAPAPEAPAPEKPAPEKPAPEKPAPEKPAKPEMESEPEAEPVMEEKEG